MILAVEETLRKEAMNMPPVKVMKPKERPTEIYKNCLGCDRKVWVPLFRKDVPLCAACVEDMGYILYYQKDAPLRPARRAERAIDLRTSIDLSMRADSNV